MDNFTYNYLNIGSAPSNRLGHVSDAVSASVNTDDIDDQSANNYGYDELGQLISDQQELIANIEWRSGDKKIKTLTRAANAGNKPDLEFIYNPLGQRVVKIEKPRVNNVLQTRNWWKYTYYAYDANGQVMATYEVTLSTALNRAYLKDQNIYGASRLGMRRKNIALYENATVPYTIPNVQQNTLGNIAYEITNYPSEDGRSLGNVNVVISDRKLWVASSSAFKACTLSRTDYFPFGMEISSRTSNSDNYRFGYNGMEQDPEAKGEGNSYTTEFRQYDPRVGRWLSLDPLMAQYPMMSPYVAFNNNPIYYVDPLGLEGECPGEPEKGYTCYDETHGETITHMGNGDWENTSKVISSNKEKIKNLESQFSAIESRISQNDEEIVKLKKEFNISVSNIKTLNSQLEQKQKEIENSVQYYYFSALTVSQIMDFKLNGLPPPPGSFGNPYPMMASGSCSSTSFVQPFMDIGQELIAGGLEMVGMDSEVSQYMSGGLMICGTLATGRIKSGSLARRTGIAYRAVHPDFAESTISKGFYKSGAAGRLGNDGIYANNTIKGAISEFQYHNPGITPAVFKVKYPLSKSLKIDPPSGYFSQPLPFTQGVNILVAPSIRSNGTYNLLIRQGAKVGKRIQ